MVAGVSASPFTDADSPAAIATGMLAVTAMAIQNAGARSVFAALSPTTVMTGNVTQIVIDTVDLVVQPEKAAEAKTRLRKMLPPVLAFALGALAGGLGYMHLGFYSADPAAPRGHDDMAAAAVPRSDPLIQPPGSPRGRSARTSSTSVRRLTRHFSASPRTDDAEDRNAALAPSDDLFGERFIADIERHAVTLGFRAGSRLPRHSPDTGRRPPRSGPDPARARAAGGPANVPAACR